MTSCRHHRPRHRGFTLAEVAMAIAVAGISLFSLIGLLPTLLDNDEKSGANSIIPTLATQAIAKVKAERAADGSGAISTTPYIYHFTPDGEAVAANDANATFTCEIRLNHLIDLAANHQGLPLPDPGSHCLAARMVFTWPAGSPPNPQRTRILHATITDD